MDFHSSLNARGLDAVPTLFELLGARQLDALISPSLRYIVAFYAQRHPHLLLRVANRYDELYGVLMGLVQYYHLTHWNSSFTEKFYGLKRTRVVNTPGLRVRGAAPHQFEAARRLSRRQVWTCLALAVGLPYLKEKLEARYERVHAQSLAGNLALAPPNAGIWTQLSFEADQLLLRLYPAVDMAHNSALLVFYLGFLFQVWPYSSPADYLVGFQYSRRGPEEPSGPSPGVIKSIWASLESGTVLQDSRTLALAVLGYTLPTSIFLLKLLEWWSASPFAKQLAQPTRTHNLAVPKLPEAVRSGQCPLCAQPISEPAVLETGVVFCYKCISRHIKAADRSGCRCPVTGQRLVLCEYSELLGWELRSSVRRLVL